MERVRIGNDIKIRWSLFDSTGEAYDLTGKNIAIEVVVRQMVHYKIADFTVDGNTVSFVFAGKDQTFSGRCDLKIVENEGGMEMMTFDVKGAFELVPHSWQVAGVIDCCGRPSGVELADVHLTSSVMMAQGPQGPQGEKGEKGDPGEDGHTPELTSDTAGNIYADGQLLTDVIPEAVERLNVDLSGKVDKEDGKGLSSNDYTDADKKKLAGIEEGAQVNRPNTVIDKDYTHTDNNFTDQLKTKLENMTAPAYSEPEESIIFNRL